MSRKFQFIFLLVFVGLVLTPAQSGFAQSTNGPLNFGNNYFVTGDYVVGGAQGMNEVFSSGYTVGTIAIPDSNPGITGASLVPPGAEVVAALLYWQTVEKTGTVPGQSGSGENGYFMPVVAGGAKAPGYPITGVDLASNDTVSYTSGGCTTTASTGKLVRTYRANVLAALPRDSTGNISANGVYEVYLPSVNNSTPFTLGATLVLIYRILSPSAALNSIVIYDGAYAPGTTALTMKQTLQGFYDAAASPISRLTHIVGQGKSSKVETVYLNNTVLPSLYGREPAFPGYYGSWDNPTWTFNPAESYVRVANPILAGAASASTEVIPANSQEGCVSWGAVIVSTTVLSSDGDGLLDSWKVKPTTPAGYPNPGYCDASVNEGVCTAGSASWVDLPGAVHGEKDVFIQLDYMCSSPIISTSPPGVDSCNTGDGMNYSFDPRPSGAMGLVTSAFTANPTVHPGIHLHINPSGTNQPDVHAILETACTDASSTALCSFPGQPGVVAWKGGFDFIKNQLIESSGSTIGSTTACTTTPPASGCLPRFQPGRRTSWHYVLSAHAVGQPEWKLQNSSLESVKQSGNTVTFTTSAAVGTLSDVINAAGVLVQDPSCAYGRVTILGAATNPSLNGTFCLKSSANPTGTTFTITVGGTATTGSYTYNTDPNLAVAPGFTSSASGVSDVGGADSLLTLGLWGNPALNGATPMASPVSDGQNEPVLAGTVMHEIGHSIGLTHGGYTYALSALGNYVPTLWPNCKPNFQSVMNYSFQVDLLAPLNGGTNVPDYSGQVLASLNEAKAGAAGVLTGTSYLDTYWYTPYNGVGSPVTIHCDGSPNTNGAQMSLAAGVTSALSWAAGQNINFDGNSTETLQGYNDWANIDLRQIGATGTNSTAEGGGQNFGGGGQNFGGGGQNLGGGGQNLGGGGQNFGGGGQNLGGGGQNFGGGGQNFGGGGEVNVAVANSVTRPPQNLTASEGAAPRAITLFWNAPAFGQIGSYNVYRELKGGSFAIIGSVTGNPPAVTYTDTTATCNATGYEYFVTAVLSATSANPGQQSVGSNTVINGSNGTSGQGPLTGCYTNTPPTVALTNLSVTTGPIVQGTAVPLTWSLQDDYNTSAAYVSNLSTNSLVAIGPFTNDGACPASLPSGGTVTPLLKNGVIQNGAGTSTFGFSANQFTFNWDTTPFNAGCYFFTLTLDSTQTETTKSPLTVLIYVSDTSPHVTTTTLPAGTVGNAYANTIYEAGGVSPFTWSYTGALPSGITLGKSTGMLSGTSCVAGNYSFTAMVTDNNKNYGTQGLILQIQQAATSTSVGSSPVSPSIYGQQVTFTATVSPTSGCPMTGTVTFYDGGTGNPISGAIPVTSGATFSTASFTTSAAQLMAGPHSITAVYSGDSNFIGSTSPILTQTVYPKPLTATLTAPGKIYDGTNTEPNAMTCTVAVVVPGDTVYCTPTSGTFDGPNVGAHTVSATATISGSSVGNYTMGVAGTSTSSAIAMVASSITARTLYVDAMGVNKTYDGTLAANGIPSVEAATSTTGLVNGDTVTSLLTEAFSSTSAGPETLVVLLPITIKNYDGFAGLNYNVITNNANGTIYQFPLAVSVTGVTKVYDGTTTATVNFSDNRIQNVGDTFSYLYTANFATQNVGTGIAVTVTGISLNGPGSGNYTLQYTLNDNGTASTTANITPAPLTATVAGTESSTPPTFTVSGVTYNGYVNREGSLVPPVVNGTLSCDVVVPSGGGTSGSNPISCMGLSAANYDILYDYSGLTPIVAASPATLTVNVTGTVSDSTFTVSSYTLSGLLNPDTYASASVNGTLLCTVLKADSSGNTPISCSGLSISGVTNTYNIVYSYYYGTVASPTLPTPLTVAVNGSVNTSGLTPVFAINSLTYSGFINTDTPSVVSGALTCRLGTLSSNVYPITCLGLTAPSYNVSYDYSTSTGIAAATPAPLIVDVTATQPTLTYTLSGLVNGNAPAVVTGSLSCTKSATADTSGNYPIFCSGLSATNYTITYSYSPGVGPTSVTPSPLTVKVSGTVQPGAAPPLNITSVTYTGFVNGDTLSSVTGTLSCTTAPGNNALTYVLSSCTGLNAPGYYTIIYSAGKITPLAPAPAP